MDWTARLILIHDLCCAYELRFGETDETGEHAAEMMRVIQAVAAGSTSKVSSTSPLSSMLADAFSQRAELWKHVQIDTP